MTFSHRKPFRWPATTALAWALLCLVWLPIPGTARAEQNPDVRFSRYTTGSAVPDAAQLDPLEAVVQLNLPRSSVTTVGDAVSYLLLRSGYRLTEAPEINSPASALLQMPLPEVHRQLGPYSVRTALSVLIGSPFTLAVDPVRRLVSYRSRTPAVPGSTAPVAQAPGAANNGRTRGQP